MQSPTEFITKVYDISLLSFEFRFAGNVIGWGARAR